MSCLDCLSHDLEKVIIVKWVDVRVYYFFLTLRGSSVGPALSLFFNGHWFESLVITKKKRVHYFSLLKF